MPETQQDEAAERRLEPNGDPFASEGFPGARSGEPLDPADSSPNLAPGPHSPGMRRRIASAIAVLVLLAFAAVLPPLINVNRYQRRIVTSISTSLGRPVHLDSVTLNLLPLPGFTLTNFVVSEDPAFGSEPVIRANTVRANLRMRSLWHRRLEFSRIALEEPSVNLVRRADGQWNIASILLKASHIPVVPTEQKTAAAGGVQRFPYIEATGARVNLKRGLEKEPISFTDADFALWLPEPEMWRVRLVAHPTRTNTAATDSGTVRIEGTLGKADNILDVPLDLRAEWRAAPLGAASWVVLGRDAGLRGEMTLRATVRGTLSANDASASLQLRRLRRSDFVPAELMEVNADCKARALHSFSSLTGLACSWPGTAEQSGLLLAGDVPDTRNWRSAEGTVQWTAVPAQAIVNALHVASARDAASLHGGGTISGSLACCGSPEGGFSVTHPRLTLGEGDALISQDQPATGVIAAGTLNLSPVELRLGGEQSAILTVSADAIGLKMRLTGTVLRSKLLGLAQALPQFGDGLAEALATPASEPASLSAAAPSPELPVKIDLAATRIWGGGQTWAPAARAASPKRTRRR